MMQLRDYQERLALESVELLKRHGLVLLLMQVRCGKTLTALRTCQISNFKRVLFVTKKAVISSIEHDYSLAGYTYSLTVTNYEQMEKLSPEYDCVIVDEFHSFGAYPKPSERTKALRDLCKNAQVIMLSGTPTPESYSQLFHPLWASGKGPWSHFQTFYGWAKHYVTVRLKYLYGRQINDYSQADKSLIDKDIEPYCLYFTQVEAGFKTETTDHVLIVPMPPVIKSSIDTLTRDKIFNTSRGVVLADTAVKLMMKTHQLCSGSIKTENGEIIAIDPFKAEFIDRHFKGKKIAIFYKYIGEREHLEKVFRGRIVDTPEQFNQTDASKVYVSQIMSGREGINLSAADALVMYNIDFSALSYWQARERPQSRDRERAAPVYWAMAAGGIEQKIYDVVQSKKDYTVRHFQQPTSINSLG